LNTGGMGAISPVPFADDVFMQIVDNQIIKPTIHGLQQENIPYIGFIFLGLINVQGSPYLIEYNARLGDPETEVILPRIQSDFLALLQANFEGKLDTFDLKITPQTAATVMLVAGGYPEQYEKNKMITGIENTHDCTIFQAGCAQKNGALYTNGGRIMAITALGDDQASALKKCYENAEKIHFEHKYYRTDIGFDL
jgi:phosphoribosylamine--glycine ligase